jgi:hypothetical protein
MELFYQKELTIPLFQIVFLLVLSTVALLFGKVKLALLINYFFTLYWGYGLNMEYLMGSGMINLNAYTLFYFGFGLCVVVFALVGFLSPSKSRKGSG